MTSRLLRLAVDLVRAWTRLYTWRLSPEAREMRRAEIDSDLWEFQQDAARSSSVSPALHVLLRLLIGVPDDLFWRVEQADVIRKPLLRTTIALTGAALVLTAAWLFTTLRANELPRPPVAPMSFSSGRRAVPPPPPPPPPAPCLPPEYTAGCAP